MSSFNKIIMMGNLTRDPEYKQLPSGQAVCRLGLASSRQMRSKNGEAANQEVCFVDIDVWGVQADSCNKFLEKGSTVLVDGRLKYDTWTDQSGQKRSKHAIVADRVTFVRTNKQEGATFAKGSEVSTAPAAPNKGEIDLNKDAAFKDELPF